MMKTLPLVILAAAASAASPLATDTPPVQLDLARGLALTSREVTLAAPSDGVVSRVMVTHGTQVSEGDVVFGMDDRLARALVAAAEVRAASDAAVREAAVRLAHATNRFDRLERAHQRDAGSVSEYEDAKRDLAVAELQHTMAIEQQAIDAAQLDVEKTRLEILSVRAPFAGVVTDVVIETGASLSHAEPVLVLSDTSTLIAEFRLGLDLSAGLTSGQTVTVARPGYAGVFPATLEFRSPTLDPSSQTVRCRFRITNTNGALPAGSAVVLRSLHEPTARSASTTAVPPAEREISGGTGEISHAGDR